MRIATEMTEKQQRAIEAMQGARAEGMALSEYAKAHGLAIRELYDAIAALRRKGLVPKPVKKSRSKVVAVRVVAEGTASVASAGLSVPLCRIVHTSGCVIECTQWPPPGWACGTWDAITGCCDLIAALRACICIVRRLI